jgi:WD40 repeat protein
MSEAPQSGKAAADRSLARRVDAVCLRFEAAWAAGSQPRIEDFLSAAPEPDRPALLRELLYLDLEYRHRSGNGSNPPEYRARFPDYAAVVDEVFAAMFPATASVGSPAAAGIARVGGTIFAARTAGQAWPEVPSYQVLGELGRGGMGVVYQVWQTRLHRMAALKVLLAGAQAEPDHLARFHTEAEAVARLQHPNIVQVYDVGQQAGCPYLVLEYVDGGNLAQMLAGTPLPAQRAAQLVETLAQAIQYAHQQRVVHRDLTPGNVLLTAGGLPKISDFGLAKLLVGGGERTRTGAVLGTPSYMAPEQAAGRSKEVGPATDVYALGAILYETLTGRPPFRGESALDTLLQVTATEPVPPSRLQPRVPRDLETVCLKCLQKEPRRRYTTAGTLAEDLGRFLTGQPIRARPIGVGERLVKWARRRPAVAALLAVSALAMLALVGVGVGMWYNGELQTALRDARVQRAQAEQQRAEAERLRGEADWQRSRAEEFEQRVRYARAMNLAYEAWQEAHMERVAELVHDWRPAAANTPDLRGWEWHYLRGLCRKELRTLKADSTDLHSVAFSPDGRWVAAGSLQNTVHVWDVGVGRLAHTLRGHTASIRSVAFHPNGRQLASASEDGTVRLWDPVQGRLLHTLLKGQRSWVRGLAFSPDGRRLAAGKEDHSISILDPDSGKELHSWVGHHDHVHSVAFSPDGRHLASASRDKTVKLWDTVTWKEVVTLTGHALQVSSVVFSPDGGRLATASEDATVKLWDAATGLEQATLRGHAFWAFSVAFSPDGRYLASASDDRTVILWDAFRGARVCTFRGHTRAVRGIAFHPDGHSLASGASDGTVKIWSLTSVPPEVRLLRGPLDRPITVVFRPDGQQVAAGSFDGTVRLWDAASGRELRTLTGHNGRVERLAFSPDGRRLASGGLDRTIKLWDAESGEELRTLARHSERVTGVAFSPDGRLLASASAELKLWDIASGDVVRTFPGPPVSACNVAFSPDGKLVVCAGTDGCLKVWEVSTGRELRILAGPSGPIMWTTFSRDGQLLATANDDTIKLWSVATGEELRTLKGHVATVYCMAFSADGRRLVSAGLDKTVKLWDTASGQETLTMKGTDVVYGVAFSPDGRRLAATGPDTLLRMWELDKAEGTEE